MRRLEKERDPALVVTATNAAYAPTHPHTAKLSSQPVRPLPIDKLICARNLTNILSARLTARHQ